MNNEPKDKGDLIIYKTSDGTIQTEVKLFNETLWLTQQKIADLFGVQRPAVTKHLNNIFESGELNEDVVSSILEHTTQHGAIAGKTQVSVSKFYNLDAIISIGYRVNTKRGTQFRIWANRILKEHLVNGFTINQKRLTEQQEQIIKIKESIAMVERSLQEQISSVDMARNVLKILADFSGGLNILDDYDHETLEESGITKKKSAIVKVGEFLKVIDAMRKEFESKIFGKAKDESFNSSVNQIYQTFDNIELYPTIEHKASMLLYFVVKNHSFIDGNKRIAAALFLYFLEKNKILYKPNGEKIISNDGLAALTLLIAISKPTEKDTMVKIILTILNRSQK